MNTADTPLPRIALLGRATYSTIVTAAGGGMSRHRNIAINRWRNDATLDDYGQWCYLRDVTTGRVWSAGHQPVCAEPSWYRVTMASDRVTIQRRDGSIETTTEIVVVPGTTAESRRVTVLNSSDSEAQIELTSYQEVVLAPLASDRAHRAFSNLFVQTEWLPETESILAMRRPRSAKDKPAWCGHAIAVQRRNDGSISCETDRARFIGRGRSQRNPVAMDNPGELTGSVGAVLDPVLALRTTLVIPRGESAQVIFTTFAADDRDEAVHLAQLYRVASHAEQAFDLSAETAELELLELGMSAADAAAYQDAAGVILFGSAGAASVSGAEPDSGRENLFATGITGEWPILLASLATEVGLTRVTTLLTLHRYWRLKGIDCDLVIACGTRSNDQQFSDDVVSLVVASGESDLLDRPRGVFVRRSDALGPQETRALESAARIRVDCREPIFAEFYDADGAEQAVSPTVSSESVAGLARVPETVAEEEWSGDIACYNGIGGFNDRGEYEIRLSGNQLPPAPWTNVVANPSAGFIVSESGSGPTWAVNSSFFRLTPWANDPVQDPPGECIYLRDDDNGRIWSATPAPIRETSSYTTRHGAGYSVFEHAHEGIATSLRVGMPTTDTVKIQVLSVTNRGVNSRRITLTSYVEWLLGSDRERTRGHVRTEMLSAEGIMLAANTFDPEFQDQVAFSAVSEKLSAFTAGRSGFLGRNGTLASPAALEQDTLDGIAERVVDACAALQMRLELAPGETRQVTVLLGSGKGREEALTLAGRYQAPADAIVALNQSAETWRMRLGTIRVTTPEPTFDLVLNQWSLYQALSCRIWGRIALYQSSGAFGFRDQLQDVMALVYAEPLLARNHIVHAASRQFEEGDVQHWWHPHSGKGVRTRFADDLIWLSFVINHYLRVTDDTSILDEKVPYLTSRQLAPEEDEVYEVPDVSELVEPIYDHCVRALRRACTVGAHGLPLIGGGDWNDGMNRVGVGGKGESVWLAWFLISTLREFAGHSIARGDHAAGAEFTGLAAAYNDAVEKSSWDGAWYRRAYYDDGTPLGSHTNDECRIDAIAQSWSVISGAGAPDRSRVAMQSFDDHLVDEGARLLMLLTPAFDRSTHDPGYIQGYLPGVRENGAQYTHAALWSVLATALLGEGDHAMHLYQMINPITHGMTADDVATYKVEPYVVAADVYTAKGHLGRGGWTWYTGSASWLYRVGLEAIIGFAKRGNTLTVDPCIPSSWPGFELEYRHGATTYSFSVRNPDGVERGVVSTTMNGIAVEAPIDLVDDGSRRDVIVTLGRSATPQP
ncbi:MAG: hypothetical protein ABIR58_03715 [Gemmatimonadaceae bacterium]